jgi:hypothetical protein
MYHDQENIDRIRARNKEGKIQRFFLGGLAVMLATLVVAAPLLAQPMTPPNGANNAITGSTGTFSGAVTAASFSSSGTNNFSGTTAINLSNPAPNVYASTATSTWSNTSSISAANAGATPASSMFSVYPQNVLDGTDFVFNVGNSVNGSSLFNIAYNGTTNANGAFAATSVTATGGAVSASGGFSTSSANGYYGSANPMLYQTTASNGVVAIEGNLTDAAAASGVKIGNGPALTSGVDRYAMTVYRDNLSTAVARVFTDGTYQNLATVGTAASGTGITAVYSGAVRRFVHKVTVTNAAMTAAGTTDITLAVTPTNARIERVLAEVTQVFSGGALSAVAVTCGKSAGGNEYLLSHSQLSATGAFGDVVAEMGAGLVSATLADMGTVSAGVPGAITVQCRYTCTGANCNAATQGSTTYYVEGVVY